MCGVLCEGVSLATQGLPPPPLPLPLPREGCLGTPLAASAPPLAQSLRIGLPGRGQALPLARLQRHSVHWPFFLGGRRVRVRDGAGGVESAQSDEETLLCPAQWRRLRKALQAEWAGGAGSAWVPSNPWSGEPGRGWVLSQAREWVRGSFPGLTDTCSRTCPCPGGW